jgi:UDP-N-acetylmuramoyl-tripeptide--D-alanyl-D-alanine ligase
VVWYALADELPEGWEEPLLVSAEGVESEPGRWRFTLVSGDGERQRVELPLHGRANVENFVAAAACALLLGLPLAEIAATAAAATPLAGRGVLHPLPRGGWLVDDSYNSSPHALVRALEAARALPGERHWAVLGSMLELGSASARYHREAGIEAALLGFDPLVAVGEEARPLHDGAARQGVQTVWLPGAEEAARWAASSVRGGDVVLVKGSRGIGLERVVAALRAEGGE